MPQTYRVLRRRQECADVATLDVAPVEGARHPFAPGQFSMLYAMGVGEIPISISGNPRQNAHLTFTIRDVGCVSKALANLQVGETLGVRGPFGHGWPVHRAEGRDLLIVAGGLGLAPLRSVIYHALQHRDRFRRVALLYGARSPDERIFLDELNRWDLDPAMQTFTTVDRAGADWRGPVGVVTKLLTPTVYEPGQSVAMLCGPEIMMRLTAQALLKSGAMASDIFVSLERNMHCASGTCGHCQLGPYFVCKDGPVWSWGHAEPLLRTREL